MEYLVIDSNTVNLRFADLREALVYVRNCTKEGNFCRVYTISEIFNSDDFDFKAISKDE